MYIEPKMSPEELKWQRRDDARTLARAEEIKADKARYQGAIVGAREIAQEEINRVKGIAKIANMKTPSVPEKAEKENPSSTTVFNKRGYRNPASLGRLL